MTNAQLGIHLIGKEDQVDLSLFANTMAHFHDLVRTTTRSSDPDTLGRWFLTDLRTGSAIAAIEPSPEYGAGAIISHLIFRSLGCLEEEMDPPGDFPDQAVAVAGKLAGLIHRSGAHLHVTHENQEVEITKATMSGVNRVLNVTVWEDYGSVEGSLEMLNIHNRFNCNIYDRLTGERIECIYPSELLDQFKQAIGQRVSATGLLRYNRRGHLRSISAEDILIFPDPCHMPPPEQVEGILPDFTGKLSTEEYVRRLRDGKEW